MKLWLSKNSEVPVKAQLIAQVNFCIASSDLKTGESCRARVNSPGVSVSIKIPCPPPIAICGRRALSIRGKAAGSSLRCEETADGGRGDLERLTSRYSYGA